MAGASESVGLDGNPVATQRRLKDILRSTVIVGGGSVVTVISGVVRGKVISMFVGPSGVGLQGLLQSTLRTSTTLASMGLQTSGVREVARLRGEDNAAELGHTLRAVRLATCALGALAALILVVFRRPLASALLDDPSLDSAVAIVGIGVAAQVLYGAYDAFLRGFRRVALITKASVIATALGTSIGALLVWWRGEAGIAWALVAQPVCVLVVAAIVGRDLSSYLVAPDRARMRHAFGRVLRMGIALMMTGFMSTGVQLAARVLVTRSTSLDDAGYFQAAWAVSVLYLGFVLGSMSLDYYPRLAEMGHDRAALRQMINEQARMSLLLAGPAVLGLLTLSREIVLLLYSAKFAATVEILRWQLMGDVLKIGCWTLSYLVLAQGRPRVYFLTELSWNAIYLGVLATLLPALGVTATAAAYVAASAGYFVVLCLVTNRLAGFKWSRNNIALMCVIAGLSAIAMAAHLLLPRLLALAIGGVMTIGFAIYCLRRLIHEAGFAKLLPRARARERDKTR